VSPRRFVTSGSPWEALAGYSRAVVDGRWVFVSGTVGYDLRTNTWPPTAETQTEMSLDTIERALREAGAALLDVVRVRAFVPDRADVEAVSGVLKKRLGAARAANTTVCSPLAVDDAKVEIEVTALKARGRRPTSAVGRAAIARAPSRSRARRRPR
jgi:enamine deaminase RidA (YjgF/YER057c/UK114 family)